VATFTFGNKNAGYFCNRSTEQKRIKLLCQRNTFPRSQTEHTSNRVKSTQMYRSVYQLTLACIGATLAAKMLSLTCIFTEVAFSPLATLVQAARYISPLLTPPKFESRLSGVVRCGMPFGILF
jgi:hypothetical protein